MRTQKRIFALAAILSLALTGLAQAAGSTVTVITIPEMHCNGCAKKITAKLAQVPGVASTRVDVEAKVIIVTPKAQSALSPRALWEAVEKGAKEPSKLEGPSGTFTAKPQS